MRHSLSEKITNQLTVGLQVRGMASLKDIRSKSVQGIQRIAQSLKLVSAKKKESDLIDEDNTKDLQNSDELKESIWDHLTNEEIEKIQNRSNLSTKERDRFFGKLSNKVVLTELYQYKTDYVRNLYAMFGKETGLKPGVCWPRKSELEFRKKYEKEFYPPLDQLLKELAEEKAKEAKEFEDRENEIRKGLKNLEKYKKEFFAKYNEKQSDIKKKEDRDQKRYKEICDFIGFELKPDDPRFVAAAEKKAEFDRKEQLKGVVKKTKQARLLEELQQLIEANQKSEQEAISATEDKKGDEGDKLKQKDASEEKKD